MFWKTNKEHYMVAITIIDLKKAFNIVHHQILTTNLERIGVRGLTNKCTGEILSGK